jgi:hypothetical protein
MTKRSESVSFESRRMNEDRTAARGPELGRWLIVGVLLLIGIALFYIYAPGSVPPAPPSAHEGP